MRITIDEVVAVIIPFATILHFNLIGNLLGTDVLCFFFITIYLISGCRRRELFGAPKVFFLTYGFWLFGAILTDTYRGTATDDLVRGWSKIIFFGLCFSVVYMLSLNRISVLRALFTGICLTWLVKSVFFPNQLITDDAWKFGYSQAITPLVAILVSMPFIKRHFGLLGQAVPLISIGAVNLLFDFRSMFGIAVASGVFCILKQAIDSEPGLRRRLSPVSFAIIGLLGFGVVQVVTSIYVTAAASGALGLDAKEKYELQSSGDAGLLISGRGEVLVSTQAIVDSPIIGHGSWARDITYVTLFVEKLEELGIPLQGDPYESDLIPTHSHLFGAWVEAGIGGGLFWIFVLGLGVAAIYRTLKLNNAPTPLLSFFLFLMVWDILFSPFGQEQRLFMASKIALVLWVLRQPIQLETVIGGRQ